jgi:hypothetical protein
VVKSWPASASSMCAANQTPIGQAQCKQRLNNEAGKILNFTQNPTFKLFRDNKCKSQG